MKKRLGVIITFLFVMIAVVFAFSGCNSNIENSNDQDDSLEEYKRIAISYIVSYKEDKTINNFYSGVMYCKLTDIVEDSISKINIANETTDIDIICMETIKEMDLIGTIDMDGSFYSLQTAYTNKKLTIENIQSISTAQLDVAQLGIKEQLAIKTSYLNLIKKEEKYAENFSIEDITIINYYGEYNGCYVLQIVDSYADYPAEMLKCVISNVVINFSGPNILVWEKTNF